MKNWREICLNKTDSIQKAIEIIDQGSLQIALVITEDNQLLGTITDGDIRRALLKHISLNDSVSKIMNANPISITINEDKNKILSVMEKNKLLHIPLIDDNNMLVGLETLQQLIQKKQYDNPVFLMAGGFGSRLRPMTEDTPKPMLRLGNQPILENIIKSFIEYGFKNFFVNAGIYVLQPEIVQDFQLEQYCDMPALLNTLIDKEKTVSMFPIHEYWLDIGQSEDFCKAEKEYLNYF